ncbi:MAG: isoleucine--tRNA ligase [Syntrophomonadaceae bacterium]|nr:isoleucine--tRNA ligase [Syntrophomonadaceae bacterium]
MAKGKYDWSLNLMKTDFPMRANLPEREPEILRQWEDMDIYHRVADKNAGREKFILHDGPPYANGNIHLGHTLNKVLKDIIIKYKSMRGFDSPYVPGWDTHGLPIEQQAIKALGIDRHRTDLLEFRRHCRDYALKYVDIQREQFKRLGVRGDWEHPYLTLHPAFEAVQIEVFGAMAHKGYIYKGQKPVYWCADCETALAEAEIEYHDKTSPSIYVKFAVKDGKGILPQDAFVIIWTTTPWTLPANVAISLHPEYKYVLVAVGGEKYLVAKGMLPALEAELGWTGHECGREYEGRELERVICQHPFIAERESLLILGEHVTLEAGTGCVHTAPGHGEEDFYAGIEYDLPVISPVDNTGTFTEEGGRFAGQKVWDANPLIIEELKEREMLLKAADYEHQYAYCWRCKNPVIYRATPQWFASIDGFREAALKAIDEVQWVPFWGRDRIYNMVRDRGDWCISRQRTWGVPIPIFYCEDCGATIINDDTVARIAELFRQEGGDVWFREEAAYLLPEGFTCPACQGAHFRKETDIMDVWFDSGSSHMAVLEHYPGLCWPADLYLEGSDQHRGWFNSSLSTSVAIRGQAPYRTCLTHGFLVDEKGYKVSKSQGNAVDPLEIIDKMGADILRLWVSSADYRNDFSVSDNIIKQCSESYRKIRNTCRFMLGNIYDFNPEQHTVAFDELSVLDRWALLRLNKLLRRVTKAYDDYEFHVVFHSLHNFCTVDMSAFYFDVLKDVLYCDEQDALSRRAAQTVIYEIINKVCLMLTPILAYTSEEIWSYVRRGGQPESIQLMAWPQPDQRYIDDDLEQKMELLLKVRSVAQKALEESRGLKRIEAALTIALSDEYSVVREMAQTEKLLIVSSVAFIDAAERSGDAVSLEEVPGVWVSAKPASGEKCERCWVVSPEAEGGEHPGLCGRCAAAVGKLPAPPQP